MSNAKKKAKKYVFTIVSCVLVVSIVAGLLILDAAKKKGTSKVTVHSAQVEKATINTTLSGTGTLTEEDRNEITVPKGVRLKEFLVKNGQTVSDGDALAIVDRVSVMATITETQKELDSLAKKIEKASSNKLSSKVTTDVAGRVIKVYAKKGDSVQDVMLKYGALAVLSLDGKMAVALETDALPKGTKVTVKLSNGTKKSGTVESCLKGRAVITITDDGPKPGDKVTVLNSSGDAIGEGELYIHNELKITGFSGTVSAVKVSAGKKVSKNATLLTLKNIDYKAESESLAAQRREKEKTMAELFELYQSQTVCAPVPGKVSGIDDDDALLLSSAGGAEISLLANSPDGQDAIPYLNYIGKVATIGYASLTMSMSANSITIGDYKSLATMDFSTIPMVITQKIEPAANTPVYKLVNGAWQTSSLGAVEVNDILLFAFDLTGTNLVWIVHIPQAKPQEPSEEENKSDSDKPESGDEPENDKPGNGGNGGNNSGNGGNGNGHGGYNGGIGGNISGNWSQYFNSGSAGAHPTLPDSSAAAAAAQMPAEEEKDPVIMAVTPGKEMSLDITIDELDILDAKLGQTAEITVDAIPGASFQGVVTDIDSVASNTGASSKYTVTLTMPRTAKMLGGMNASATIVLEEHAEVLSVPVSALVDVGSRICVYTSYDKKEGLGGLKEITTGVSDGENVEIISGLSEGDTVWYEYYDMD